jgi:hypothetical protein
MSAAPAAPEEGRPVSARTPTTSQLTEPQGRFSLLQWTLLLLAPLVLVPVLGPFALPAWLPWLGYSLASLYAQWHRPRRPRRDQPASLEIDGSGSLRVNGTVRR